MNRIAVLIAAGVASSACNSSQKTAPDPRRTLDHHCANVAAILASVATELDGAYREQAIDLGAAVDLLLMACVPKEAPDSNDCSLVKDRDCMRRGFEDLLKRYFSQPPALDTKTKAEKLEFHCNLAVSNARTVQSITHMDTRSARFDRVRLAGFAVDDYESCGAPPGTNAALRECYLREDVPCLTSHARQIASLFDQHGALRK